MAQYGGESIATDFKPSGKEFPLAMRLTGKFKTAFPEGKPKTEKPQDKEENAPNEQKKDERESRPP